MRTLGEIIDSTRNGERPEYDELRYAVCALQALSTFDDSALRKLAEAEREGKPARLVWSAVFQFEERFNRWKRALGKSPKEWVGWNNDPDNPGFVERRKRSVALYERAIERAASREKP